ncbi:MAG: hypothetical protein K5697_04850 [Lachnospiraceae bacterium]|nr:hypothetical protein [Lachnospiraceae bacterium]
MAKKLGGFILFGLAAGAAAAGVYHYLSTREKELADIDDFDDLENSGEEKSKRSYVNLESVKTFAGETFDKAKGFAKEAYDKVSKKVQEVVSDKKDDAAEAVEEAAEAAEDVAEAAEDAAEEAASESEDFFDDKE